MQKHRNKILFLSAMYTKLNFLCKHVIQTNPSKFDEMLFSDISLCRLRLKQGREITGFYVLRQGVPEGRSSKDYASFKQVKPWPWHVEVNPRVSVVRLVANNE